MKSRKTSGLISGVTLGLSAVLAGCVQVSAPDKPIVINLNINIKQEVVYRLDGDAKDLINSEAEIF
ncbi:YnbE family lipoprotein [Parasphingorhabdus cellanae]|uniref:YnbE family lipoprotein n=2 Tax=Parasphingorhabdus cellanae TaxID=2806553 RepID=A0ABX7T8H9_9SPHN|nr:YnbE family lipoprotein [Parasphingorhabdus cellanae]QTD57936.1 YnbE family lipoprotein [Parasphingorhabdus cellanae]